jgi:hypothetical protein
MKGATNSDKSSTQQYSIVSSMTGEYDRDPSCHVMPPCHVYKPPQFLVPSHVFVFTPLAATNALAYRDHDPQHYRDPTPHTRCTILASLTSPFHTRLVAPGIPSCHVPWPRFKLMVSRPVMIYIPQLAATSYPWAHSSCALHATRVTKCLSQTVCRSADLYLGRVSLLASLLSIDSKRVVAQRWRCQIGRNK